jgi:hypothetical protein
MDARAMATAMLQEAEQAAAGKGEGVMALLFVKAIVFALFEVADAVRERPPYLGGDYAGRES